MAQLFRISEAGALALFTVEYLSQHPGRFISAQEIAAALKISVHHLRKVHQRLTRVGILRSGRGPKGGVQLAQPPEKLSLMDVIDAIEGVIQGPGNVFALSDHHPTSTFLNDLVEQINSFVGNYFNHTTVARLAAGAWK